MSRLSTPSNAGPENLIMSTSMRSRVSPSMSEPISASGPLVVVERAVDQVHAEHAQGLLLARVLLVPHPRVDDDLRRPRARLRLEPDAQPALPLLLRGNSSWRSPCRRTRRTSSWRRALRPAAPGAGPTRGPASTAGAAGSRSACPGRRPRPTRPCRRRRWSWPRCRRRRRRGRTSAPPPGPRRSRRRCRTGRRRC